MGSYNKTHLLTSLAVRSGQVSITIYINLIRQEFWGSSLKEGPIYAFLTFFVWNTNVILRVKQQSCNHEVMKHEDENYTQDGHAKRENALFLI